MIYTKRRLSPENHYKEFHIGTHITFIIFFFIIAFYFIIFIAIKKENYIHFDLFYNFYCNQKGELYTF